jgi:hypothetical protein
VSRHTVVVFEEIAPPCGKRRRRSTGSILPYREPGRRPRRPAPPRRHPPPPLVHPCTGKSEGPPGGCTDGPSIRLPSRRGSPYPRVVLLSVCFLPASLPTAEVGDHDQDHRESRHFTSPPSTRFGLVDLLQGRAASDLLGLTSRPCRRRSTRPPRESPREPPSFTSVSGVCCVARICEPFTPGP